MNDNNPDPVGFSKNRLRPPIRNDCFDARCRAKRCRNDRCWQIAPGDLINNSLVFRKRRVDQPSRGLEGRERAGPGILSRSIFGERLSRLGDQRLSAAIYMLFDCVATARLLFPQIEVIGSKLIILRIPLARDPVIVRPRVRQNTWIVDAASPPPPALARPLAAVGIAGGRARLVGVEARLAAAVPITRETLQQNLPSSIGFRERRQAARVPDCVRMADDGEMHL